MKPEDIFSIGGPKFENMLCNPAIADKTFFAHEGEKDNHKMAKSICAQCVHKIECKQWADDHNEFYGTWGEETEKERRSRWRREGRLKDGRKKDEPAPSRVNQANAPRVVALRKQGFTRAEIIRRLGMNDKGVDRALAFAKRKGLVA